MCSKQPTFVLENSIDVLSYGLETQIKLAELSKITLDFVSKVELENTSSYIKKIIFNISNYDISLVSKPLYKKILNIPLSNADIINSYKSIKNKITNLSTELELEYIKLLRLITYYDKFYSKYLFEFSILEDHIKILEEYIKVNNNTELSEDLEKRLIDLKLTKQATLQKIVNIKIVHENNKLLMEKINFIIYNTLPLWENTLYQLITVKKYQAYSDIFVSDEFKSLVTIVTNITNESTDTIEKIDNAKKEILN